MGLDKKGKPIKSEHHREIERRNYLDGHKIDYVKGKVAFDLEWNSKDQTFDRDLYAFNAFFQSGVINVGVLVTRGESLNPVFKALGPALRKDGKPDPNKTTMQKIRCQHNVVGKADLSAKRWPQRRMPCSCGRHNAQLHQRLAAGKLNNEF